MLPTDIQFEQTTVSEHVNQYLVDYMFVRDRLIAAGVVPCIETSEMFVDKAAALLGDANDQLQAVLRIEHDIASREQPVQTEVQ